MVSNLESDGRDDDSFDSESSSKLQASLYYKSWTCL